jgi:hypothetical protein
MWACHIQAAKVHCTSLSTAQVSRPKVKASGTPASMAAPNAVSTAGQWTSAGAIARNEAVSAQQYLSRTLWRRWSGYHRRSRVETKMHCMKLPGQSLMARDFYRQVAEIHVRIAVLNRYTALGIPVTEPVG